MSKESYVRYRISPEELNDLYTFKLIKRVLMKRFPWIKNVFVNKEDLEKYNLIFLNFDIDPELFAKTYNHNILDWIQPLIDEGQYLDYSFPHLLTDMTYEEWGQIRETMKKSIQDVVDSPSVPEEYKLPPERGVDTGTYHINRKEGRPDIMM